MATATSRQQRLSIRQDARRRDILAAAAEEFARVGYDAATLDRIGDRVGLSKASLYHYVRNKEALLVDLLAEVTDRIAELAVVGEPATASDRLRAFVRAHVQVSALTREGKVLTENLDALMSRSASTELAEQRRRNERLVTDIIEDGIRNGEFRPVNPRPTVKLLFGALNGVPRWYDPGRSPSMEELLEDTVDLVLHALAAQET